MSDTDNPPKPASLLRRLAALFYDSLLLLAIWFIAAAILLPLTGGVVPTTRLQITGMIKRHTFTG